MAPAATRSETANTAVMSGACVSRRRRITQAPFNFNGRDASLQRELDIPGVHGRGEDNPVDTALEQRFDAFAFPVLISAGIEEQDVEALLRRCLLGANDDFGDEWNGTALRAGSGRE